MMRAYGAYVLTLPVTRSSKRIPRAMSRSRRLDRPVDVLPAVHAHVAVGQRVALVDGADAEQRLGDRDAASSRRTPAARPRPRRRRTPWPARMTGRFAAGDLGGRELELPRMAVEVGLKPGSRPMTSSAGMGRGRLLPVSASLVMSTWTGPGRPVRAMWKASAMTRGDVVGVADQVVVLGHRQRDAGDVDLLEGVLADERRGHVAGDGDDRDGVQLRRGDAGHEVRRAGAGGAHAHADPARSRAHSHRRRGPRPARGGRGRGACSG